MTPPRFTNSLFPLPYSDVNHGKKGGDAYALQTSNAKSSHYTKAWPEDRKGAIPPSVEAEQVLT